MSESEVISLIYSELLKVLGGSAVLLAALSAFLGKIWINRIANKESQQREQRIAEVRAKLEQQNSELKARLDASIQRSVFVDKLQFEHEYSVYKQAWEALYELRKATLHLRPMMDWVVVGETAEERMTNRINAFVDPFNTYRDIIENNKPFYAEAVYAAMYDVLDKCHAERIDYEYRERPRKEYFEEARKNHQEIVESIDAACQAIRNRVSEVRVV